MKSCKYCLCFRWPAISHWYNAYIRILVCVRKQTHTTKSKTRTREDTGRNVTNFRQGRSFDFDTDLHQFTWCKTAYIVIKCDCSDNMIILLRMSLWGFTQEFLSTYSTTSSWLMVRASWPVNWTYMTILSELATSVRPRPWLLNGLWTELAREPRLIPFISLSLTHGKTYCMGRVSLHDYKPITGAP